MFPLGLRLGPRPQCVPGDLFQYKWGGEKCKEGEFVKEKVTPLKGMALAGVSRHPKKESLKIFSSHVEAAQRRKLSHAPAAHGVTAFIYKPVSEQRKPKGKCKHAAQGKMLRVLLGRMGIYRKGWRPRFMRLEPICQALSRGFPLPWSSHPSCIYDSTDFCMSLILKVSITGTEQNYAIRGIIN